MLKLIQDLFRMKRYLMGEGYDQALDYINKIVPLEILEVSSGTQVGNWTVPQEWIMRDGWVKFNGEKILDYKDNPLSVAVYSQPIHTTIDKQEFIKHLFTSDEKNDNYAYDYHFYDAYWGFTLPKNKIKKHVIQKCEGGICTEELADIDPSVGQIMVDGAITQPIFKDILEEGEYEVFIDSELKPGTMKIGVHTIPGKTDREILLFAHLDHPHQANDNLSGVACLVDMAQRIKDAGFEHTIRLIFCPETIGSVAYAELCDISKVDFVIALDAVGNDNSLLIQKAYDKYARLNYCVHLASAGQSVDYRKGEFRMVAGSDEYYFNDPRVNIPGLMLSRLPYPEYHTELDTPNIIKEEKLTQVQDVIMRVIDIYEKDYIPDRAWVGPLMRQQYGIQTPHKLLNREMDYLFYEIDGKKYLSEIILALGLGFDFAYKTLEILKQNGQISSTHVGKVTKQKTAVKKHKGLSRKSNVAYKRKKVSKVI